MRTRLKHVKKNSLSEEIESLSEEYRRYKEEISGKFRTEQVSFETSTPVPGLHTPLASVLAR